MTDIGQLVRSLAPDLLKEPTDRLAAAETNRQTASDQLDAIVGSVTTLVQAALDRIRADQSSVA